MTSAEWAVVAGLLIGAYASIIGTLKWAVDAMGRERQERHTALEVERVARETAMGDLETKRLAGQDKVLDKLDDMQKTLGDKVDRWAERVGERQGALEQRVAVLETKAER